MIPSISEIGRTELRMVSLVAMGLIFGKAKLNRQNYAPKMFMFAIEDSQINVGIGTCFFDSIKYASPNRFTSCSKKKNQTAAHICLHATFGCLAWHVQARRRPNPAKPTARTAIFLIYIFFDTGKYAKDVFLFCRLV